MENLFKNKLKKIILYGSYARNEQTEESDMDIMVLVDESQEVLKKYDEIVTDIMVDLSLKFNIVLSIYLQSYQEYNKYNNVLPFFCNIEREGIQIYG
jgi:predicted nucleotidyltransferase